jgi:hypothetical protein
MAMWNFNMSDLWQSILGTMFKSTEKKSGKDAVKSIWDELRATGRPADKRAGLFIDQPVHRLGEIDRIDPGRHGRRFQVPEQAIRRQRGQVPPAGRV